MRRFFLSPEAWESFQLTGDEARHCSRVLRLVSGDKIEVFDGLGRGAEAEIVQVGKHEISLNHLRDTPNVAGSGVILAQALPKGKAFEMILQKATELGVEKIIPLVTDRTVARQDTGENPDKWERILLEACKQCGRNLKPELLDVQTLRAWLEGGGAVQPCGFGSLEKDRKPIVQWASEWGQNQVETVTVMIGPEGDFSTEECSMLRERGCIPLDLGPVILRSDTAALCAVSVVGQTLRWLRA